MREVMLAVALAGICAGCAGPKSGSGDVGSGTAVSGTGVPPVLSTNTGGTPVPPQSPVPPQTSEPIYRNPKIGVIYLRAHEDAQGRLLGPQVMYQVTEPGGWNVDALDAGKGTIPEVNREAAAGGEPPPPAESPLIDPDQASRIIITGLMNPGDKAQAEALAAKAPDGSIAMFDDQAGWLILPKD